MESGRNAALSDLEGAILSCPAFLSGSRINRLF